MNKVAVIGIVGDSVFLPVERFHSGGETVEAIGIRREFGGKGFNQAVAAARWGAEVSFLAAVGKGNFSRIQAFLFADGISSVLIEKEGETAFAAIMTDKTGANRVTVYQGVSLERKDVSIFEAKIKDADVLLLNNEVDASVNAYAIELAQKYSTKIILNPAPAKKLPKNMLDKVWLFTPNEHEGAGLENYNNVVQTLGKKGCVLRESGELIPPTNDVAVDTTGAGDTFNGVLAAELAAGHPLAKAVAMAVKASGKSVTNRGAVSSIPYKTEFNEIGGTK